MRCQTNRRCLCESCGTWSKAPEALLFLPVLWFQSPSHIRQILDGVRILLTCLDTYSPHMYSVGWPLSLEYLAKASAERTEPTILPNIG